MRAGPRLALVVDDSLPQQQLREPMPRRHQIAPYVVPSPDQVPRGFLFHTRNRDPGDLPEMQQPGQMPRVTLVGLDPIPDRTLQLRRGHDQTLDVLPGQEPGQPETRRTSLIRHHDRARQRPQP
jgi:hypothetical protein